MSITTGRGDSGETDLLFGRRISKTSTRISALGAIDELNAALGIARCATHDDTQIAAIERIQDRLVALMGRLACHPDDAQRYTKQGFSALTNEDLEEIETLARTIEAGHVRFTGWAVPGAEGSLGRAAIDFARAISRRAERELLALGEQAAGGALELERRYLNRLSDLLWLMARKSTDGSSSAIPFS